MKMYRVDIMLTTGKKRHMSTVEFKVSSRVLASREAALAFNPQEAIKDTLYRDMGICAGLNYAEDIIYGGATLRKNIQELWIGECHEREDFSSVKFHDTDFIGCDFINVFFKNASFHLCNFLKTTVLYSSFENCAFDGCDFNAGRYQPSNYLHNCWSHAKLDCYTNVNIDILTKVQHPSVP